MAPENYIIKTPKGYVVGFSHLNESVVFTEDRMKAAKFNFPDTARGFVVIYADAGYGLFSAECTLEPYEPAPTRTTLDDWQQWLASLEADDSDRFQAIATYLRPPFKFLHIDNGGRAHFAAVPYKDKATKERCTVRVIFNPHFRRAGEQAAVTVLPTANAPAWAASFTLDTPRHIINATAITALDFTTTPKHPQKA